MSAMGINPVDLPFNPAYHNITSELTFCCFLPLTTVLLFLSVQYLLGSKTEILSNLPSIPCIIFAENTHCLFQGSKFHRCSPLLVATAQFEFDVSSL